jgi:hypothetical protein
LTNYPQEVKLFKEGECNEGEIDAGDYGFIAFGAYCIIGQRDGGEKK